MQRATLPSLALLFLGAAGVAACGGGGGSSGGGSTVAAGIVSGQVIQRDGTTQNLGGVSLTLVGVGRTVTTAADGSFSFGTVPTGNLAIAVSDPLAPRAAGVVTTQSGGADDGAGHDAGDDKGGAGGGGGGGGGNDDGAGHDGGDDNGGADGTRQDDDGDAHDVGDDDFDVAGVAAADTVTIRLALRGGKVESIDVCHGAGRGGRVESRSALTVAATSDDADAVGSVRVESRVDRQRLSVEVEKLASGRDVTAFVLLSGVEASIGKRTVDLTGKAEWEIATNDGGVLPLGVATVAELAGATVEVRDATSGLVLLTGTVPDVTAPPAAAGAPAGSRSRGRSALTPTAAGTGSGHIDLRRRVETTLRGHFGVEVEHQTAGVALDVFMEDGVGSGTFANVGSLTVGARGEAELELETEHGATLPFGVLDVADLVGRAVEIRRASDGVALLTGQVPTLVSEK